MSEVVTIRVPMQLHRSMGRSRILLPDGALPREAPVDNALLKAMARTFRWKEMLESGEFSTIRELAEREAIAPSYMTRVLRLTLLAPDIVEGIVDRTLAEKVDLTLLLDSFPLCWKQQSARLLGTNRVNSCSSVELNSVFGRCNLNETEWKRACCAPGDGWTNGPRQAFA